MGLLVAGSGSVDATLAKRLATSSQDMGRVVLPLVITLWLAVYILIGKPNSGFHVYQDVVLLQVLFAVPVLAYVGWLLASRRLPGPTPLDLGALCLIVAYALATATSVNPRVSLETSLLIGTALITFYVAYDVKALSFDFWVRVLLCITIVMSLLGLLSIAAQLTHWMRTLEAVNGSVSLSDGLSSGLFRIRSVLDHPSPFAMFLNLTLPFAVAFVLTKKGADRALGGAALLFGGLALFFTLTRGAWLGTIAWSVVFGALFILAKYQVVSLGSLTSHLPRVSPRIALLVAATILVVPLAVLLALQVQPDWLFRATLDDRLEAVKTAVAIFRDNLLSGSGPYTYSLLDDLYADHAAGIVTIVHAHNIYLQVLSGLGLIGAVGLLIGMVLLLRAYLGAWLASNPVNRLHVAAGVAAVVGVMVHGLSDAPPSWNSLLIPLAILLAITVRMAPFPAGLSTANPVRWRGWLPRASVLVLVPLTFVTWTYFDIAHVHYDRSVTAMESGDLDLAGLEASRAADADPSLYAYAINAGVTRVRQHLEHVEAGRDDAPALLDEGIAHLRRGAGLEPFGSLAQINLALALQLRGDIDAAVLAAGRAIVNDPGDAAVFTAAGTIFEAAGLNAPAIEAYAAAVSLDATLTQAPFWASTPDRLALRMPAIERSDLDQCEAGAAAALYGVYWEGLSRFSTACALQVEASGTPSDRANLALILAAQGSTVLAREQATLAFAAAPGERDVLVASAVLLADDVQQARKSLLRAHLSGHREAMMILAATYLPGAGAAAGIDAPIKAEAGRLPDVLVGLLPVPPATVAPGATGSGKTRLYYSWSALREAPPVTMIPGDWTTMFSPRYLLGFAILEAVSEAPFSLR